MSYIKYYDTETGNNICFFSRLDKILGQQFQEGDDSGYDNWKIVPKEDGKYRTFDSMIDLLHDNKFAVWESMTHVFTAETDTFKVPDYILYIHGYFNSDGDPILFENLVDRTGIHLTAENEVKYKNKWSAGSELKLIITPAPTQIVNDGDPVVWPRDNITLLLLDIAIKAMGERGKAVPDTMYARYAELKSRWAERKGPIRSFSNIRRAKRSFGYSGRG